MKTSIINGSEVSRLSVAIHLLCLAMRKDAFVDDEINVLEDRGWKIIDC